jgi:signal transduction histidine kinase
MNSPVTKWFVEVVKKYPGILAALVIYGYYLATTVDLFEKSQTAHLTTLDFILQFDSLFWMWLTAFVFVKLQKSRESHFVEERQRIVMQTQLEKSALANSILKDITAQLQDTINNPLAIIRMSTEEIRSKFEKHSDVIDRLDQIDASLRRVHNAIKDVAMYEATRILDMIGDVVQAPTSNVHYKEQQILDR